MRVALLDVVRRPEGRDHWKGGDKRLRIITGMGNNSKDQEAVIKVKHSPTAPPPHPLLYFLLFPTRQKRLYRCWGHRVDPCALLHCCATACLQLNTHQNYTPGLIFDTVQLFPFCVRLIPSSLGAVSISVSLTENHKQEKEKPAPVKTGEGTPPRGSNRPGWLLCQHVT